MKIYDKTGNVLLDIEVDDTSVRYKVIKGENSLTLKYSLAEHIEVPLGSYCIFKNERYYLMLPENFTMKHRRNFEYDLLMYSEDARSKRYKFINPVDGRLKFSLTAKPVEHLQMFVDNMNMRDGKDHWSVGECPEHVEIVLSYNHTFCYDALVQLANELELDYWFNGNVVNLGKLELNKDNPLPLSYGGDGEGLKQDIKRANYSDALPLDVLYVQGSDKNIDPSKYGSSELHLPKGQAIRFDGTYFEDEEGFDGSKARSYVVDANGYSIRRSDKENANNSEDSLDCTEIYPTKEETVEAVIEDNKEKHYYDILFKSTVDYKRYTINGEKATIIFQSSMLAGKEFDLATDDRGNLICKPEGEYWRMEIVPQEIDGITMPDPESGYMPNAGESKDTFKVFNIQLPDEYISDDATKSGAEWEVFRYAVKHMYANEDAQYTITGTLDEIYAKRNWENIEGRLQLGNYISFSDKSFQAEPLLIRITGIKEYVNKPHSPVLEISNAAIGGTLIGTLNRIENQEVTNEDMVASSRQYTKRSFRSAQQTLELLQAAFTNFSEGISPVTVRTMAMLVGDESLQFKFTGSRSSLVDIPCPLTYDAVSNQLKGKAATLIHMTLGIDVITPKDTRTASDYRSWDMVSWESAILENSAKSYYVYVKASQTDTNAEYFLSDAPIDMEGVAGYYHFLVGILNSEYNGSRDFVTLYGFTEVLPGQITTDVIRSADGKTYFDLLRGIIGGNITFLSSNGAEKDLASYVDEQIETNQRVQDQIDGVVENWNGEGTPTLTNEPAATWIDKGDAELIAHINDTYINIEEYKDDETTPTAGHAWRWCQCTDDSITDYVEVTDKNGNILKLHWHPIADSDAVKALKEVAEAKKSISDMEYLTDTFKKGSTVVSGGVVMTEMVAVRDTTDAKVEAFLNGSNYGADDEHGKLLIAAGIDDIDKPGEAKTRVYEDGHIQTNDIEATGGVFSNVKVLGSSRSPFEPGATYIENEVVDNHFYFSADGAYVVTLKSSLSESGRIMRFVGNFIISCSDGYIYEDGKSYYNKAIYVGPIGELGGRINLGYEYVTLVAVPNEEWNKVSWVVTERKLWGVNDFSNVKYHGVYGGLRPNIRRITTTETSASPHELTALDHTIIVDINTSGTVVYLKLPAPPPHGQRYEILTTDADIDLNINHGSVPAYDFNTPKNETSGTISFTAAYRRHITFIYDATANKWFYFYENLT